MTRPADLRFLRTLSQLAYCNPFLPERLQFESQALGKEFQPEDQIAWSRNLHLEDAERPNVVNLTRRADEMIDRLRAELDEEKEIDADLDELYQDLVSYVLYYRHVSRIQVDEGLLVGRRSQQAIAKIWRNYLEDFQHYLTLSSRALPMAGQPDHIFACFFQVRRAFRHIFDHILGDSRPAAEVRAMVWQSVFTHDMRRYRRTLFDRMRDLTTLVTGPSGTGKELVARAISLSQYMPFDAANESFNENLQHAFLPVNLSAFSPTLIESELFGHAKGSFTGAIADRSGWLEGCPVHGVVFLDEIGELDPLLQVKLLRVVQNRTYTRIGETNERQFVGKLIAATNRDLASEIHAGRFREDLYYRLCSDRIEMPSLRTHLNDRPEALAGFVSLIACRLVGEEAEGLTAETLDWINRQLGPDYPWPGNIRELEQCVRNILVHRQYKPSTADSPEASSNDLPSWLEEAQSGTLTHAELLTQYCTWVYSKLGSYQQVAAALGLDRRTVKAKVDHKLLKEFIGAN